MSKQLDLGHLMTEQINPASVDFDALPTVDMLSVFNREDKLVAEAVERELPHIAEAVDAIAAALRAGGRLFLHRRPAPVDAWVVLDASECPPTFNVSPDLVVGFLAGGDQRSPQRLRRQRRQTRRGRGRPVGPRLHQSRRPGGHRRQRPDSLRAGRLWTPPTNSAHSPSASPVLPILSCPRRVRIPIEPLSGPEVITGSTRLKAGTATKLVLNMLSSGVMVRLGYVYSNLMVNVQPTNEKLVDRAQRIIHGRHRHEPRARRHTPGRVRPQTSAPPLSWASSQ